MSARFTRRRLLSRLAGGIGGAALGQLFARDVARAATHFAPRAKHVIYLVQSGGPSHVDLFDYKPELEARDGELMPASALEGKRLTTMTAGLPARVAAPIAPFARHGASGAWVSDLLPNIAGVVDRLAIVRSMVTDAVNHDPALALLMSGHERPGRPSLGSWTSYGLGAPSDDLPTFVVLFSENGYPLAQPIQDRLWGSAFLPARHQGTRFRASANPVLYLENGAALPPAARTSLLDAVQDLNALQDPNDPRIATYELAYRMQTSVPELTDLVSEPPEVFEQYGDEARTPGTHAANCLLARRLVERGVPFVQIFHRGWDQHVDLPETLPLRCAESDRPTAALIRDLDERGLLDETLVVWAGEFGRTPYKQAAIGDSYGRDHHPYAFTVLLAGGGTRAGIQHGATDDLGMDVVEGRVHVHDLNATILHLLGFDHLRLTYRHHGRDFRLTDVAGRVVSELLA